MTKLLTLAGLARSESQSFSPLQCQGIYERNVRNSIAKMSLENERAKREERGKWKFLRSSFHSTHRKSQAATLTKENVRPIANEHRSSSMRSLSTQQEAHTSKQSGNTAHVQRLSRSANIHASPLRDVEVFMAVETPIPENNISEPDMADVTQTAYMVPQVTPSEPRLDFYDPTDPFADAILFDEQYAFRRRRIPRNSNKTSIAFHLPTGSKDLYGNIGV